MGRFSYLRGVGAAVEKGKSQFAGTEIMGRLWALQVLAPSEKSRASAAALGMNIVGYDPFSTDWSLRSRNDDSLRRNAASVRLCDHTYSCHRQHQGECSTRISLHASKDSAVLLTFSRDKLVNEVDLLVALESGKISVYVTDFPYRHPGWQRQGDPAASSGRFNR